MATQEGKYRQSLDVKIPVVKFSMKVQNFEYEIMEQSYTWNIFDYYNVSKVTANFKSPLFHVVLGAAAVFDNAQLTLAIKDKGNSTTSIGLHLSIPPTNIQNRNKIKINVTFGINSQKNTILKWSSKGLSSVSLITRTWGFAEFASYDKFVWNSMYPDPVYSALSIACNVTAVIESDKSIPLIPQQVTQRSAATDMPNYKQLRMDYNNLYNNKEQSDVTFVVGDHTLPAHKLILSARSSVFRAMFQTQMLEAETNIVTLTDITPIVFNQFLHYLYSGTITVSGQNGEDLLGLADKYDMKDLKGICESYLASNLTVANAARIFLMSNRVHAFKLKNAAVAFIKRNLAEVKKTNDWQMAEKQNAECIVVSFVK